MWGRRFSPRLQQVNPRWISVDIPGRLCHRHGNVLTQNPRLSLLLWFYLVEQFWTVCIIRVFPECWRAAWTTAGNWTNISVELLVRGLILFCISVLNAMMEFLHPRIPVTWVAWKRLVKLGGRRFTKAETWSQSGPVNRGNTGPG